jgi:uncharacterized hydantoinase/oxoprolinase family protein
MAKKSTSSYEAHTLPSNFPDLEHYLITNKTEIMEKILNSIEHAIKKKTKLVEVFKFENSDFIITLTSDRFEENMNNISEHYIKEEKYELCARIGTLKEKLAKYNN